MMNKQKSPPLQGQPMTAYGLQRRNMLKFLGASAAVITIGSACSDDDNPVAPPTNSVNLGSGDVGVLNYAYALEQLEAAFYLRVTANPYTGITQTERDYLNDIRDHEVAHREFFKAVLAANAIGNLEVDFSKIDFTNRAAVLGVARTFEDLGVSAYNGAGKLLTDPANLGFAGKIVSVEARHAATIRELLQVNSFADTTDANGLDPALPPSAVLAAAGGFIKTPINFSNLPTS